MIYIILYLFFISRALVDDKSCVCACFTIARVVFMFENPYGTRLLYSIIYNNLILIVRKRSCVGGVTTTVFYAEREKLRIGKSF